MGLGIAGVQLSKSGETKQASMGNASEQSPAKGLFMLLLAASCSGFASVYTEKIFKQVAQPQSERKLSVWTQNMQLASFTLILATGTFAMELLAPGKSRPASPLRGFTGLTYLLVVN